MKLNPDLSITMARLRVVNRFSLFALIIFAACTQSKSPVPVQIVEPVTTLPFQHTEEGIDTLQLATKAQVKDFYKGINFETIWIDTFNINQPADSLLSFIRECANVGLYPNDYHLTRIEQLLSKPIPHEHAVQLDAYLTDAYFTLAHHLRRGRVVRKTLERITLDSLAVENLRIELESALKSNDIKQTLLAHEPRHSQYHAVKCALKEFLKSDTASTIDSVTIRRKNQLIATLERWRWQPQLPDRFLSVNIPAFELKVVEDDSLVFSSKVIIGKKETPTPNISSVIRSFIIYPYWHVPKSILDEILPAIQTDTNYIRKHNYEVLDRHGKVLKNSAIDWKKFDAENFPYTLRQREGSENTMGVIKFVFPNNYGVYLHDTNARGLFSKKDRALSHGCIRVHKAVALARYLAKDDDTYVGPDDLDEYLLVRKKMVVNVVKPLPVFLDYFTVESKDGKVFFYDDIYDWDDELVRALRGERLEMPEPGEIAAN